MGLNRLHRNAERAVVEGADIPQELVVRFLDLLHLFIDDQLDILADHAIAKGARKA